MKNGQPYQSREKPHLALQRLWINVVNEAVQHMREKGMNIHQRMSATVEAKVLMRNNEQEQIEDHIRGTYYRKGYGQSTKGNWEKISDMTNDSEVYKEFIQPRIQDWKNIYEKLFLDT